MLVYAKVYFVACSTHVSWEGTLQGNDVYYFSYAYDFYVYRVRLGHRKYDRRLIPHDAAPCGSGALDLPSRLLSRTGTSPLQLHALTPDGAFTRSHVFGWEGRRTFLETSQNLHRTFTELGRFCVLPNQIHGIA